MCPPPRNVLCPRLVAEWPPVAAPTARRRRVGHHAVGQVSAGGGGFGTSGSLPSLAGARSRARDGVVRGASPRLRSFPPGPVLVAALGRRQRGEIVAGSRQPEQGEGVTMKRQRAVVVQTLERAGLHDIAIEASQRLDDPVEQRELETFLQSHGINRDVLVSLMGGSP